MVFPSICFSLRGPFVLSPHIAKFVIPEGVSQSASHEKSNAFGSIISESKKLSSKDGTGGTSTLLPCPLIGGAILIVSVSEGGAGSLEFSDAILETGSAQRSKQ
jgi:hypothetical protein